MTFTANTIAYVDGNSANKTAKSYTDGTNDVPAHVIFKSDGTIIDPATAGNQTTANTSLATVATNTGNIPAQGQALAAASMPVVLTAAQITSLTAPVLAAGTNTIGAVSAQPKITTSSAMTRPADTAVYAFGDFIGNSTTAASCTIGNSGFTIAAARGNDIGGTIIGAQLTKSGTGVTNCIIRAHIYNVNPLASAPTGGDNAAFVLASNAGYLGYMDFALTSYSTAAGVTARGILCLGPINFAPATGTANLFAVLEAHGVYTPSSAETFTLTLEVQ